MSYPTSTPGDVWQLRSACKVLPQKHGFCVHVNYTSRLMCAQQTGSCVHADLRAHNLEGHNSLTDWAAQNAGVGGSTGSGPEWKSACTYHNVFIPATSQSRVGYSCLCAACNILFLSDSGKCRKKYVLISYRLARNFHDRVHALCTGSLIPAEDCL